MAANLRDVDATFLLKRHSHTAHPSKNINMNQIQTGRGINLSAAPFVVGSTSSYLLIWPILVGSFAQAMIPWGIVYI
jgi:hypothetical protein